MRAVVLRDQPVARCHFDPDWYLAAYADVALSGRDPWQHYRRHGWREGRLPALMPAVWRERDLRRGLLDDGGAELEEMARDGHGPNAIHAAIACARIAGRAGAWQAAQEWLGGLDPRRDLIGLGGAVDPVLLGLEAAVETGDFTRARACLDVARRVFGALPDLALAESNMVAARGGTAAEWRAPLVRLYRRGGLVGVEVAGGDLSRDVPHGQSPAFDRLRSAEPPRPCGQDGPLVSVIMPARNAGATIATALNSLTAQSWQLLEIVVVDNGSQDDTAEVVRACGADDPRIRLLDGAAEPGAYAARNIGMQDARGAFLTVLDADDWAHPQRIAQQVAMLERQPDAAACITDWVRTTPEMRFARWWQDDGYTHPDLSSLMIRAGVLERLGYWDRVRAGADSEYHDRIEAVYGAHAVLRCCPGIPLGFGRQHAASLTQSAETRIDSLIHGARRSYVQRARRWHRRAAQGDLPLPARPERRPFAVPEALALAPRDPDPDPDPDPVTGGDLESGGIYDDDWYMRSYPDLRTRDTDGLGHYLSTGAGEGRDPGPGFSTSGYAMAQGLPLQEAAHHYLSQGREAGLAPLPVWTGARTAAEPGQHVLVFGHQAGPAIFGAERCLLATLDRAIEAGLTPSVVLPRLLDAGYLDALLERCAAVHVLPYGWRFGGVAPDGRTLDRLAAVIRDSGAVEVHQNTCVLDAPLRAARLAGVPSVLHVHELPQSDPRLCADLGQSAAALRDTLLAEAARFIVPSGAVRDWLDAPRARVLVLPNRADPALFDLPFAPGHPPRVALIGSMTRRKGLHDMATVARLVAKRGLAADFRLVGPRSADLERLGPLPGNLQHMGYAPSPRAALEQADIVLSLSQVEESFGMSVLEALSAGRPVVCYDHGHPPKLLGPEGGEGQRPGGIVVPRGTPEAVAEALRGWLSDPAMLRAASEQARAHARDMLRNEPDGVFRGAQ